MLSVDEKKEEGGIKVTGDVHTDTLSFATAKTVRDHELVEYFQRLQAKFEYSDGIPVAVFDGINKDSVEAARNLWYHNRVTCMRVMTSRFDKETATCQLFIFELASSIHSRVSRSIGDSIQQYLRGIGCYRSLIIPIGDGRFDRSDGQGEIEPDESYTRLISSEGGRKITVIVEVGWSQQLGPVSDDKSLLGKAKEFVDIDASLVILVKLFGYKPAESLGMVVALVSDGDGVFRVWKEGNVPDQELRYFQEYNDEHVGGRVAPDAETMAGVRTLHIDGKYIVGFELDELDQQIALFPQINVDTAPTRSVARAANRTRAALLALRGRPSLGRLSINLQTLYDEFVEEYDSTEAAL